MGVRTEKTVNWVFMLILTFSIVASGCSSNGNGNGNKIRHLTQRKQTIPLMNPTQQNQKVEPFTISYLRLLRDQSRRMTTRSIRKLKKS